MKCVSILTLSANLWRNFETGRTIRAPLQADRFFHSKIIPEKGRDRKLFIFLHNGLKE
ncbi:MAG: hypothetical protein RIM23_13395 [Coleofasciculus sp. G3-WIS-01]|uniref:hypothetical protein n=1 Tax=Coleofasciculus sp. G3-WIS-01 TaxID=3069528 RepID=UPI0032FBAB1D